MLNPPRFYPHKLARARAQMRRYIALALYKDDQGEEALAEAGRHMSAMSRRGIEILEAPSPPAQAQVLPVLMEAFHDGCRHPANLAARASGKRVHNLADCDPETRGWHEEMALILMREIGPYLRLRHK